MTPDVPRLRNIAKLALSHSKDEELWAANLIAQTIDAIVGPEGPLSSAPPDGAAEREAPAKEPLHEAIAKAMERHKYDHWTADTADRIADEVIAEMVDWSAARVLSKPTPAPTEAPAAGDGGEGFTDAAFAAYNRWVSTQEMAPSGYPAFFAGAEWAAALARPAAVTDEMVEAFCLSFHGERWLKWLEEIKAQYRADAGVHLTAALAARGPA